jgi:GR25 family glycosyltransferase involved in LPS biosynthesis
MQKFEIGKGLPKALVNNLIEGHRVKYFVETGTGEGYSALSAIQIFDICQTIELMEGKLSSYVSERIRESGKQIDFHYGDSVGTLPRILKKIPREETVLFFLNAYYDGKEIAPDGTIECPILQEIAELEKWSSAIIVIGDAPLFMGSQPHPFNPKNWVTFKDVFNALQRAHPTNIITLVDECIISIPKEFKENFDNYWRETYHQRYEYVDSRKPSKFIQETTCLYINLDKDVERKEKMESLLKRYGIEAERMRGTEISETQKLIHGRYDKMVSRGLAVVGCYVSHFQTMLVSTHDKEKKYTLIMEDDLVFCDDFHERLDEAYQFLKDKDWDIFWLGGTYHVNPPVWHDEKHTHPDLPNCDCKLGRDVELTDNPRIVRTYGIWSTYAYILNKEKIDKISRMLAKRLDDSYSIDHAYIMLQPELKTYAYVPALVKQYDSPSNIQGGDMKFSQFASLGKYWFANNQKDVDPSSIDWKEARI